MTRILTVIALLALTSCGPELIDDLGGESGDSESLRGTCDHALECDEIGCWAVTPLWADWAEWADPWMIKTYVTDGVLIKTEALAIDGDCYEIDGTDAHVCVVMLDCVPLLTRPVHELPIGLSNCSGNGPWMASEVDGVPGCWGQLPTVAFRLRP